MMGGPVRLTVLGCGDAFGSGGRANTCFLVEVDGYRFLLDCGATALVKLKGAGFHSASVSAVVCTHLHGDHIGGIPFLLRDPTRAETPDEVGAPARTRTTVGAGGDGIVVAGPPGIEGRVATLTEAFFPGATASPPPAPVRFVEFDGPKDFMVGPLRCEAVPVRHVPGSAAHALRTTVASTVIAFTGDTEWVDDLVHLADGADLLIAEGYCLRPRPGHLDIEPLTARRRELRCGRLLLTHPGPHVLGVLDDLAFEYATDGMVVDLG